MYILSVNMWFQNLIRTFFYAIDNVIFGFIPTIYNLLIDIARTSVLSQSDISSIATRVYQLLAIFMVFKVIFSLIMYVVNPDDFSDKSKGVSKLGTNIVISLALLILVPYIFSYAFQLQTIILEDDSLGTLVFGDMDSNEKSTFSSAGDKLAYMAMAPFIVPNTSLSELKECVTLTKNGVFNENCSGLDFESDEFYIEGSDNSLAGIAMNSEENKTKMTIIDVANYVYGIENESFGLMHRQEIILATAKFKESYTLFGKIKEFFTNENEDGNQVEQYLFEYRFIFSTAVGVIILILLISFCMDVAVRSIKLSFLQLIAPIPILSYIDPKSGKDGLFKKWYQLCFKTYVSLFVRLLALYLGIFIISRIDKISDIINGSYQSNVFVKIFVIIGVLMFVKQLPKLLEGLGIKLDGDGKFTLNPIKKFGDEALGGKKILGFGAAGLAAGAAGLTNFASRTMHPNSWRDEEGKFSFTKGLKSMRSAPGSAIAGAASAMWRGGKKAMREEKMGKIFGDSYGEAMFAKLQREDSERQGSTFGGRWLSDFNRVTGNLDAAQNQKMWAAQVENDHTATMNALKEQREAIQRSKSGLAKRKRDATEGYLRRKAGYEGMQKTIDGYVNKGKTFKTEMSVWDSSLGKYVTTEKTFEYNVKEALENKQKLIDNGNYTVKLGQKIAERDDKNRIKYDDKGNIMYRTATAEDVRNGVKTDEARIIDEQIKMQQDAAYKYLTSKEGRDTEKGKTFEHYRRNVESTLDTAAGETVAEGYDDIKLEAIQTGDKIANIEFEFEDEEKSYEQAEIDISEKEAVATDEYIEKLRDLDLDKNSEQWKRNEANHRAKKITSGQKQPENFDPSADNAYSWRNTNMMLGNGPDVGGPGPGGPGPGGPGGGS